MDNQLLSDLKALVEMGVVFEVYDGFVDFNKSYEVCIIYNSSFFYLEMGYPLALPSVEWVEGKAQGALTSEKYINIKLLGNGSGRYSITLINFYTPQSVINFDFEDDEERLNASVSLLRKLKESNRDSLSQTERSE